MLVIAYCKVPPETLLFRDCFVRLDSEVVSRASSPGFFLGEDVSGLYASAKKNPTKNLQKKPTEATEDQIQVWTTHCINASCGSNLPEYLSPALVFLGLH